MGETQSDGESQSGLDQRHEQVFWHVCQGQNNHVEFCWWSLGLLKLHAFTRPAPQHRVAKQCNENLSKIRWLSGCRSGPISVLTNRSCKPMYSVGNPRRGAFTSRRIHTHAQQ